MLIGLEAQPGAGDFADQRQPCRLIVRLGRLEARPRGIALTAQAAEKVQLVGRKARRGLKRIGDTAGRGATTRRAHQGRQLAAPGVSVDANGRKKPRLGTVITGPRFFDTGRELTQAAVVDQGHFNQLAQSFIDHKTAPVFVERLLALATLTGGVRRPLLVDGCIGLLVGRFQRTTTEQQQRHEARRG